MKPYHELEVENIELKSSVKLYAALLGILIGGVFIFCLFLTF